MNINPRIGVWLNIITAVLVALIALTTQFTTLFGADTTSKIMASLAILFAVVAAINAALHAIPAAPGSSSQFALGPSEPTKVPLPVPANDGAPDWPPVESASGQPDGVRKYGSTGQLFEVQRGQWIRVKA